MCNPGTANMKGYQTHHHITFRRYPNKVVGVNDDGDREVMIVDAPEMETCHTRSASVQSISASSMEKTCCCGIHIPFPPRQNEHIAYLFALHYELSLPWNYHSIDNHFFLQLKSCSRGLMEQRRVPENEVKHHI